MDNTNLPLLNSAYIILTLDCNFNCVYCYETKQRRRMTSYTLRKTLDFLVNPTVSDKQLAINFFGGEPLLYPNLVFDGIDYARELGDKRGIQITGHIVTNMSLMTSTIADKIYEKDLIVYASFDGMRTQDKTRLFLHNKKYKTSMKIFNKIKMVVNRGIKHGVALQMVPGNLSHLFDDTVQLIQEGEVKRISLSPIIYGYYDKYSKEDWEEMSRQFDLISEFILKERLKGNPITWRQMDFQLEGLHKYAIGTPYIAKSQRFCKAARTCFAFDPDGYIVPCWRMPSGAGFDDRWVLGHVSTGLYKGVREDFLKIQYPDCSECGVMKCAHCMAANKIINGNESILAEDSCTYQRLLFTHAVKMHNKLVDAGYYDR